MNRPIRMKIKSIRYEMPELLFAQAVSEAAQEMPEIKITEDMLSAAEDDAMEINTSGLLSIEDGRVEFSYDIVIMNLREDASYILRKNGSGQYVWNQLPDFTSFEDDYRQIKGADMWKDLRQCYYDKKIAKNNGSPKYKDIKSFQLLHQAVKETLSRF